MYQWRSMTEQEREETLKKRKVAKLPWHSPKHRDCGPGYYLITGTCYEHKPIIGMAPARQGRFSDSLLTSINEAGGEMVAWCVLPNHYHLLAYTEQVFSILKAIRLCHGRTSRTWNLEDNQPGRRVFRNYLERFIRTEEQFRRTINYVHHNPVKHGYVKKWMDWEYSSARIFLESAGRQTAVRHWMQYPIGDFGKGWDD